MASVLLKHVVYLIFSTLLILQVKSSTVKQLKIEDCFEQQTIKTVGESIVYEIVWNGGLPADDCKYRFIGGGGAEGGSSIDKYKICVDVKVYLITDCNVALRYYTLAGGKFIQTEHRCGMSPPKLCNDENQKFDIELSSNNKYDSLHKYPSSFILQVSAVKTFDYTIFAWTIAGIVISVTVVFIIVVVVVIIVYRYYSKRQKASERRIYSDSKKSHIYQKKSQDNPYTVPIHAETPVKRAPSFSSISSEQFENSQENPAYLPYTDITYDKTAHIY